MPQDKNSSDPHTIRASVVMAAIEGFSHQQKIMAETLNGHTVKLQKLDVIEERVDELTDDMDVVKNILGKHSKMHEEHSRKLDEHSKTLNQHSKILNTHTKILDGHSRDLKLLKADMAFVEPHALTEVAPAVK